MYKYCSENVKEPREAIRRGAWVLYPDILVFDSGYPCIRLFLSSLICICQICVYNKHVYIYVTQTFDSGSKLLQKELIRYRNNPSLKCSHPRNLGLSIWPTFLSMHYPCENRLANRRFL